MAKKVIRTVIYLTGLFTLSMGINLSILSRLGISPVSAFILPISQVVKVSLGTVTTIVYILFVILQAIILRKNFKIKNWLQIPFSFVFGFFVDFTRDLLNFIQPDVYLLQFWWMLVGVIFSALGITLYILMDIVPNPPGGLNLAIAERFKIPFSKTKILLDCLFVVIGVVISLLFLNGDTVIGEGTMVSAILTGYCIGYFMKALKLKLSVLTFNKVDDVDTVLS